MNRNIEEQLIDFAADQHLAFSPSLWLTEPHPTGASPLEIATVAQFLAYTTFGHEIPLPAWANQLEEMLQIVSKLDGEKSIQDRVKATEFQPDRFANALDQVVRIRRVNN